MNIKASQIFETFRARGILEQLTGPDSDITSIAPVERTSPGSMIFVDSPEFVEQAIKSNPAAIVTSEKLVESLSSLSSSTILTSKNVRLAQALIRQAYILQPEEASIVDSMGWIAYRRGRIEEAVEFLAKAWELDKNPEIAAHLGEVLWVSGKKEQALQIWREGREIDAANLVLVETLERLDVKL